MISVDEAQAALLAAAASLSSERVPLTTAVGRTLAEPVVAARAQPPFPASAMDGYAIRAADLPGPFRLVGEAAAGRRHRGGVGPGEAVRIFTGAPVPDGADAVLIQEDAEREGEEVRATDTAAAGENIRRQGLDFAAGATLLAGGERLTPAKVALAAAAGHPALVVARRPRVAFLSTGDELVEPGAPVGEDQIVASTTPALMAMAAAAGAEPRDCGIVRDDRGAIARRAADALAEADVLVTLGGASVGEHDLIQPALEDLGIRLDFWRVAVRPGKPLMFASSPLVLGLPGNPVSGLVCTILFLLPLLRAMQGATHPLPRPHRGVLGRPLGPNGPRRDHLRARFENDTLVPFERQDSSMLSVLACADALIVRPPHEAAQQQGAPCIYLPL